jgi:peroxiredoxin
MGEEKKKRNWMQLIGFFLIIFLGVEDGMLILQNRELKRRLNSVAGPAEPLKPGEQVKPLKAQDLDGKLIQLSYRGAVKKHLLFVFSTKCPHCEKNLPRWQSIVENKASSGCDIIGISVQGIEDTRRYAMAKSMPFRIVSALDTAFIQNYKITGFPETIMIEEDGSVKNIWVGELSTEQVDEIDSLLSPPGHAR